MRLLGAGFATVDVQSNQFGWAADVRSWTCVSEGRSRRTGSPWAVPVGGPEDHHALPACVGPGGHDDERNAVETGAGELGCQGPGEEDDGGLTGREDLGELGWGGGGEWGEVKDAWPLG